MSEKLGLLVPHVLVTPRGNFFEQMHNEQTSDYTPEKLPPMINLPNINKY